jgi:hypothetical protein
MTLERSRLAWTLLTRRFMRPLILGLCLLAATACAGRHPVGPTVGANERFTLAPNEVATVRDFDLNVQFVNVTGDSRCPADAVCIQGGDALVHIRVIDGGASSPYELHTGDSSRASVTHKSARIALVELQPYPFSSRTIAPGDYRATLTVSR